jgi:hypothetical protein
MNSVAINNYVQLFECVVIFWFLLDIYLGVELLGHYLFFAEYFEELPCWLQTDHTILGTDWISPFKILSFFLFNLYVGPQGSDIWTDSF